MSHTMHSVERVTEKKVRGEIKISMKQLMKKI